MQQAYGIDVLEIEPNADQDRASSYTRTVTLYDNKTGKLRATDRSGVAIVKPEGFSWVMFGRAEIQAYRDFLDARKGACVGFWVPTWQHDIVQAADLAANSATLVVQRMGYTKFMWSSPARRYLAFLMLDGTGTKYYRKVVGAAEGASTETLTLDSAISGAAIAPGRCMICFLTRVRLAVDDPQLVWHSRDVAEVVLDFVELPNEVTA